MVDCDCGQIRTTWANAEHNALIAQDFPGFLSSIVSIPSFGSYGRQKLRAACRTLRVSRIK
jgi:hypothetical protein